MSSTMMQSRRVLVVEDNADTAKSLAMLLKISGHQVRTALNGLEALQIADEHSDVVLLDIGMPKMDGYETARRLRERPGTKDSLIIAVTGYGRECDVEESLKAGCDLHLVKPVDPQILLGLLNGDIEQLIATR